MEDMMELILSIIVIGIGIAAKSAGKKKKKAQDESKEKNTWDEVAKRLEEKFDEFIEQAETKAEIPYAPAPVDSPAAAVPPVPAAVPAPAPVIPEGAGHQEGKPAEKPRELPRLKLEPVSKSEPAPQPHKNLKFDHETLKGAVVMSEVLGRPVALRRK